MREDFDYLDNILFQSIKDIKVKKYSDNRIQEIMIKAKFKKKEKHKLILKVSVIISFLFISIFSIAKYSINNYIDKENIITINNEKNLDNNVIEYESSDNGTGSSYTELTPKELFELANYVAVVKIENGLKGVNYDREYSAKYNGEYHYTYVRTIGKMNVIEVFKGNINIGDTLEFRKKGGKILYSEYLKYFEENTFFKSSLTLLFKLNPPPGYNVKTKGILLFSKNSNCSVTFSNNVKTANLFSNLLILSI